ncbi:GGDEF domain-containing protein [Sulfurivermis fontis]|uniref:GGDEF domain-containing protein n=1 Tax=Sulfurivermis fontis TaxID=1972068 RepID=UPI000FDC87D2|nr:GGDEF domain-containing protein [Sulfurivermis fontis]
MTQDERLARELEQWRSKYYDGLTQLERKEKEWRQTENVLRQCISRLSLAADSSDRELNQQLDKLRGAIRKSVGSVELEAMIQSLSEHLVRLDQQRRSHGKPVTPLEVLRRLADGINFPRGLGHKARAYGKALAAARGEEDYQPYLQELIALIGEAFDWLAGQQGEEAEAGGGGKGLLGRLFRREEGAAGTPMPAVERAGNDGTQLAKSLLAQLLTAAVAPAALRARLEAASRREELQRVTAELATLLATPAAATPAGTTLSSQEVLLQLLERLAVPAELHGEAEAIKTALGIAEDEEELGAILGRIADLVTTMRTRAQSERAEVESFLKQLTCNLQELDMSLRGAVAAHRETVEDGRALDAEVQVQMQGIEDSVRWAQNLEHLKQAVQERVATIRRHMEVFRNTEDERIERAEREVERLNARLRTLESETEALRGRIQQERSQALIDPLTEIANRLAYNERIAQEYARWKRYRSSLVFTVWDVDHFKRINDTYGHQAGDKVLKVVAKLLSTQVRETDFVARYGGEEFIILLPETDLAQARMVTEKIRAAVESCEFHYRGERVLITISCGLAQFREQDDPDTVFARADAAMYRAKAAGRNCCRAEDEP